MELRGDKKNELEEQEDRIQRTNSIHMRDGDWRCKLEECRGEINLARRRECWKCGPDKAGK